MKHILKVSYHLEHLKQFLLVINISTEKTSVYDNLSLINHPRYLGNGKNKGGLFGIYGSCFMSTRNTVNLYVLSLDGGEALGNCYPRPTASGSSFPDLLSYLGTIVLNVSQWFMIIIVLLYLYFTALHLEWSININPVLFFIIADFYQNEKLLTEILPWRTTWEKTRFIIIHVQYSYTYSAQYWQQSDGVTNQGLCLKTCWTRVCFSSNGVWEINT